MAYTTIWYDSMNSVNVHGHLPSITLLPRPRMTHYQYLPRGWLLPMKMCASWLGVHPMARCILAMTGHTSLPNEYASVIAVRGHFYWPTSLMEYLCYILSLWHFLQLSVTFCDQLCHGLRHVLYHCIFTIFLLLSLFFYIYNLALILAEVLSYSFRTSVRG